MHSRKQQQQQQKKKKKWNMKNKSQIEYVRMWYIKPRKGEIGPYYQQKRY